jgi:hypothetical protein
VVKPCSQLSYELDTAEAQDPVVASDLFKNDDTGFECIAMIDYSHRVFSDGHNINQVISATRGPVVAPVSGTVAVLDIESLIDGLL